MAKRDKALYDQLRDAGLRKSAAARISEAAEAGGKRKRKVLNAAAAELQQVAGTLEDRVGADESTEGTTSEKADASRGLTEAARETAARAT